MSSPEFQRLKARYPQHVFVILEKAGRHADQLPDIDKNKFIIGSCTTVGQFIFIVRKRMTLGSETALFLFVQNGNVLPMTTQTLGELAARHASPDGFLRILYTGEATFGSGIRNDASCVVLTGSYDLGVYETWKEEHLYLNP
jgi:GABA(A) receptor-associated protein